MFNNISLKKPDAMEEQEYAVGKKPNLSWHATIVTD